MKRIFCQIADVTACSHYRAYLPAKHCYEQLLTEGIELVLDTKLNMNEHYDAYYFHRFVTAGFMKALRWLKTQGRRIYWELDDLLMDVAATNPVSAYIHKEMTDMLDECFQISDKVVVTTERLRQELGYQHKTVILPNLIDLSIFPAYKPQDDEGEVRVLWQGSSSHQEDVEICIDALHWIKRKYKDKVRLTFFGGVRPWRLGEEIDYVEGVPLAEFYPTLARLRPHIGIAPLLETRFSSCKSAIKWFEYTAVNAVTVASHFDPYRIISDSYNGMLAYRDEWYECLCALINSLDIRNGMLINARRAVKEDYSWEGWQRATWLDFFRQMVTT